jgi:hypothetical protein
MEYINKFQDIKITPFYDECEGVVIVCPRECSDLCDCYGSGYNYCSLDIPFCWIVN